MRCALLCAGDDSDGNPSTTSEISCLVPFPFLPDPVKFPGTHLWGFCEAFIICHLVIMP